ncbi:MAG: hypothetical protein VX669_13620 [Planctomycetota bacterium]|nr:hypothetical protein [Planctomycetota bacterium]
MRHSGANCESIRLGGLVACAAACVGLVLTGMSVYAQGTDKKAAKKPATAPKKSAPAAKKPASAPKKSAPAAKKPARPSGPPLPLGFVPPPPLPQVMGLNNSLLNAKDELAFRRSGYSAFMKAVRSPGLGSKAQKDIQAGIRWWVARMTMPKNRESLPVRRRETRQLVQLQAKSPQVRSFVLLELKLALSELLETAHFKITHNNGRQIVVVITRPDAKTGKTVSQSFKADTLEGLRDVKGAGEAVRFFERYSTRSIFGGQGGLQNFHVRLNVAYLLGELVVRKGDPAKGIPAARYTDAAYPLCDVINEPRQLDAIKVVAVRGLVRLMQTGQPDAPYDLRLRVAECFVNQLKRPFQRDPVRQRVDHHLQHIWYQEVLVEGLAGVGIMVNKQAQPFVEIELAGVMADPNRHFLARTAAAKAIGRAPLAAFDDGLRSYQLVELAGQMAAAYNKSPNSGFWPRCYQQLYFAFKAVNKDEVTPAGKPAGLLGQVSTARLQDAYRQVVPLVAHVIVQPTVAADGKQYFQAISSETLKPVTDWLAENRPANYKPLQPSATTSPTSTPTPAPKSNKGTKPKATTGAAAGASRS